MLSLSRNGIDKLRHCNRVSASFSLLYAVDGVRLYWPRWQGQSRISGITECVYRFLIWIFASPVWLRVLRVLRNGYAKLHRSHVAGVKGLEITLHDLGLETLRHIQSNL